MKDKRVIWIAAVCLVVVIALAAGWLIFKRDRNKKEIIIGALLPLSGDLSSQAEDSRLGLLLAHDDIQNYLKQMGSKRALKLVIEDTKLDPATALLKIQQMAGQGIKFIIGPGSSEEILGVKDYAAKNGVVLISPTSSAPALASPQDNVYRMVPDDRCQAQAVAALMADDGIKFLIPMYRNDTWGNDLANALTNDFSIQGGQVVQGIRYDLKADNPASKMDKLSLLTVMEAAEHQIKNVAIALISFDETSAIFKEAAKRVALAKVRWYGSDSVALNQRLVSDPETAAFAEKVEFACARFSGIPNETSARVIHQIEARFQRAPSIAALTAYDALWLSALATLVADSDNLETLKRSLEFSAATYYGASGWAAFDENGDRRSWNYDFWAIRDGQWKKVARYENHENKVKLLRFEDDK